MDIYECNQRYGISLKKLRRMEHDGALKLDKPKTPEYWRRVLSDIRKGKMSARSIALAYRYPEKLHTLASLTNFDRTVLDKHFRMADLPTEMPQLSDLSTVMVGVAEKNAIYTERFLMALTAIIPDRHVGYEFVAVRLLLTCENDHVIDLASKWVARALTNAMDLPRMKAWWHREQIAKGKYRRIYHRPKLAFDL